MIPSPSTNFLRRSLFALGFMTIGAVGTASVLAAAGPGGHGPGGRGRAAYMQAMVEDLDLTDAQKTELTAIKTEIQALRDGHREDRQADLEQLSSLVAEEKLDRKAIHKEVDERLDARAKDLHDVVDSIADFHATLSAEQRATLAEKLGDLSDHMSRRGGRGPGEDCEGMGGPPPMDAE